MNKSHYRPTIDELRVKTGLKKTRFAIESGMAINTYRRIAKLDPTVSDEYIQRCLNFINKTLQTNYDLEDVRTGKEETR